MSEECVNKQLSANIVKPVAPCEVLSEAISKLPDDHSFLEADSSLSAIRQLQLTDKRQLRKFKNEVFEKDIAYDMVGLMELVDQKEGPIDDKPAKDSEQIVNAINDRCELVCDQHNNVFARTACGGSTRIIKVTSHEFWKFATFQYYTIYDRAPPDIALKQAVSTLEAQGSYDGRKVQTAKRVFEKGGVHYIDLCNEKGEVVKVDPEKDTITVTTSPPVFFIRTESMRSLPAPEKGGDVRDLLEFVNVREDRFLLLLAWVTLCFRGDVEYCLLEIVGSQGSAKSSTQKYLKMLVDPNTPALCRAPAKSDDFFVLAEHHHLISLENMSRMSDEISDDACMIITGGGLARRRLYSDSELSTINVRKPMVINGISPIVERQDLLDRTLHLELPKIETRRPKSELDALFEKNKGKIFGDLLQLFLDALIELKNLNEPKGELPRLADFAMWGEAIYQVFDERPGSFVRDFKAMQVDGIYRTIESSPVAMAMKNYVNKLGPFEGLVGELYVELERYKPQGESWPKSAKGLANAIRRYGTSLEKIGIEARIDSNRTAQGYTCVLREI